MLKIEGRKARKHKGRGARHAPAATHCTLFSVQHWLFAAMGIAFLLTARCTPPPDGGGNDGTEPVFPTNYRSVFAEVRDCRLGIEHGGVMFRVYANEIARDAYLDNQDPLPVGSVLVKEEFDGPGCTDDSDLFQWRVMRKEAPGFDPDDGDWHWQRVLADRRVVEDTKASCIRCHRDPECLRRDYMCTEP